jgi:hypothetical protein
LVPPNGLIDHDEGHLSPSRLHYDVPPAINDPRSPKFFKHCDQCDVIDEVDVQEECDFRLRETALHGKEPAVYGLLASAADGSKEVRPVVRSEGADFDATLIAQYLNR